nr:hypothetical protein B0A51_13592 [Rachicladosporium sp. CCFEE 5018]
MSSINFNPDKDIPSLAGKVIFITGGTAGLGSGSIRALAKHEPAQIIFSGRNEKSANALIDDVRKQSPNVKVTFVRCDISSLASVQECATTIKSTTDRLDIFMLNAGIMAVPPATSADGYEIQFATNHVGHALLVKLLLPLLQHTAKLPGADVRVINMTSIAYQQAPSQGIDFATLKSSQANLGLLSKWARYGQSKLAQMLYTDELASHYPQITWVSIHPGVILTGLFENTTFLTRLPVLLINLGKTTPVEKGHFAQCWAATAKGIVNGQYYEPIGIKANRTTSQARDKKLSARLWEWTETELAKW